MTLKSSKFDAFLEDIEPFYFGHAIVYVDVGAYTGDVFKRLLKSPLKVHEAHLVEPNPTSARALKDNISGLFRGHALGVHEVALGDSNRRLRLRDAASMSQVIVDPEVLEKPETAGQSFEVEAKTLDDLAASFSTQDISILKVDVEGFEASVLAGAAGLLSSQRIDVVYIEAGMDPKGTQQCYFRIIDDILLGHGYRLFRLYEQTHEWLNDSPFLRRVNLAYFSSQFAAKNPAKLVAELHRRSRALQQLESDYAGAKRELGAALAAAEQSSAKLRAAEAGLAEASAAAQKLQAKTGEMDHKQRRALAQAREAEERARALSLDRMQLIERLSVLTQENQGELRRVEEERQRCSSLLGQLGENTQELARLRGESEGLRTALNQAEERVTRATRESERLLAMIEEAHRERLRLVTEVGAATAARDAALGEVQRVRRLLRQADLDKAAANQRATRDAERYDAERKNLADKIAGLEQRDAKGEAMGRRMVALLSELLSNEKAARVAAQRAEDRESRLKGQLSYRLGSALVSGGASPRGILRLPSSLVHAYSDYRREAPARRLRSGEATIADALAQVRDRAIVVPNAQSWTMHVRDNARPRELWVEVFAVGPQRASMIEMTVSRASRARSQFTVFGGVALPRATAAEAGYSFRFTGGEAHRIMALDGGGGAVCLTIQRVRGYPCVLRFELRPPSSDFVGSVAQCFGEACLVSNPASESGEADAPEPSVADPAGSAVRRNADEGDVSRSEASASVVAQSGDGHAGSASRRPARLASRTFQPSERERRNGPIWFAQKLVNEGYVEEALSYAERHANALESHTIHLLRANLELGDDDAWLNHANTYLSQFGIAPLALASGNDPRYLRLRCDPPRTIDMGPLVTVIMPVFNAESTLLLAARSILGQTWRNLELIIVDDNSTDASFSIAQGIRDADHRVRILRNERNVGPYVSKNLALNWARGDYLTGHDADDWAHPERLEFHLRQVLVDPARAQVSLCKMLRLGEDGHFCRIGKNTPNVDDGALQTAFISCMLETRFMKAQLGHWDSVRFGADSELISRARAVLGCELPVYRQLGMLCLDAENGLTNDVEHGVSRTHGLSPTRAAYRDCFGAWHDSFVGNDAHLSFPHSPRRFSAPAAMLVPIPTVEQLIDGLRAQQSEHGAAATVVSAANNGRRERGAPPARPEATRESGASGESCAAADRAPSGDNTTATLSGSGTAGPYRAASPASPLRKNGGHADICIVTNLAFPGGNASSTLAEIQACRTAGLTVQVLHCPTARDSEKPFSERFAGLEALCMDARATRPEVSCAVVIVRHPGVIAGACFREVAPRIHAERAVFVVNNSMWRTSGESVYSLADLAVGCRGLATPEDAKAVYPLGPLIRAELESLVLPAAMRLSLEDWPPLFDEEQLMARPPRPFARPITIGRHARDGQEKWPATAEELLMCYPPAATYSVRILGGAHHAKKLLGKYPANWEVLPFGALQPCAFLRDLDVLVYYPHSTLVEAFGRTVMEAVFVGIPCLLPPRLAPTFRRMAFYCEAQGVEAALQRLAASESWRREFVARAQRAAIERYSVRALIGRLAALSPAIANRVSAAASQAAPSRTGGVPGAALDAYATWVGSGRGDSRLYEGAIAMAS